MTERMSAAEYKKQLAASGNASGRVARGRKKPDGMNKLEARYSEHLQGQVIAGAIAWFRYEAIKLRLADNTFYTPDFFVMLTGGELEVHETKGYWEEDARIKVKVAAAMYPFRFKGVKHASPGGWSVEVFE